MLKTWKGDTFYLYRQGLRLLVVVGMIILFILGSRQIGIEANQKEQKLLEEAIKRASIQCYAIEGSYPISMEYLKKYYGIQYKENKYVVYYDIFASNRMPEVHVLRKTWEDEE